TSNGKNIPQFPVRAATSQNLKFHYQVLCCRPIFLNCILRLNLLPAASLHLHPACFFSIIYRYLYYSKKRAGICQPFTCYYFLTAVQGYTAYFRSHFQEHSSFEIGSAHV